MRIIKYPYTRKKDPILRDNIRMVMHQLEKYGRAETSNPRISKVLAWRFKPLRKEGDIRFIWDPRDKKSVIILKPGAKLIPTTPKRKRYKMVFDE